MVELKGISCYKEEKYCLFCVNDFTDEIKDALRSQFTAICHGVDYASSNRAMYNYQNTVNEFLKRYERKSSGTQIGMIGELLIHLLIERYFGEYKVVTPFFNMEERSIKKGFDVVLTEVNSPTIWLIEVKSGELHRNKNANQTMQDLLSTAKTDLDTRLNEENTALWHEAINGAKIALDSKNKMKEAVIEVLMSWGDEAYGGNNNSRNKNVILSGVLFCDITDSVNKDVPKNKQMSIEQEAHFNKVYVIAVQKGTYDQIYQFLRKEAKDELQ